MTEQPADSTQGRFDYKPFLATLTQRPGVYRMLDANGKVLYVGKAKNLKRRVSSYFGRSQNQRIARMVAQIRDIEIAVTHTEAEALILENNLIKSLKPRYNILLRDDKGYPYLHLSDGPFPRLSFHRGSTRGAGRFFGPYPSAAAVRETLHLLQKLFPVRQCEDSFYRNRSRPCLQYQIKRCSGPCCGMVEEATYAEQVADTVMFLEGRAEVIVERLVKQMEQAAADLEYEQAALLRDRIVAVRAVQEKQHVSGERGDLDIIAVEIDGGVACVQQFVVRAGRNLGNKTFFPRMPAGSSRAELIAAFLGQHYIGRAIPREILVSDLPDDIELLSEVLGEQAGYRVQVRQPQRGSRVRWMKMAAENARIALAARLASNASVQQRLEELQNVLDLDEPPQRMECFDISHTAGELTVASCVVFEGGAPKNSDYRRFNIEDIQPGDDYAAMAQALARRYRRVKKGEVPMPDLLLIDGGKGQLSAAAEMLQEEGVSGVQLLGVAKGADRKPGLERLFLLGREAPIILPDDSPALHLIQQIRDEAHRFAITGHRQRRNKSRRQSVLEDIPGIGPKRRQSLLKHFGGLQRLERAGVEDIARVNGVSRQLAEQIYEAFHGAK